MNNRVELIKIKNLKKHFPVQKKEVLKAVDGVSLTIYKGETLGVVGESGCGKSTLGRTLIKLYHPTEGEVKYNNQLISEKMKKNEEKELQKKMQMIFQDPYSSLNARMTVREIIAEGLVIHYPEMTKKEREQIVMDLLKTVGLADYHANRFPHEFSGGQRQRIGIARALAVNPEFIIADEPIAALDVSIQAQIINLLKDLQREKELTYLFIAHDLSMVRHISTRVAVMYLGNVVELAPTDSLYEEPLHPYTQSLLSAIPVPDPNIEKKRQRIILEGSVPSPINPPSGCKFRTRCQYATELCAKEVPVLKEVKENHYVACHLVD